jgi:hypothetical protein
MYTLGRVSEVSDAPADVAMSTFILNRRTRLLVAVLLLMAGSSAGMRHAHPGGSGAHHHDSQDVELLASAFPATGGNAAWFAAPLHMHIYVLGFQFTVPAEESADDEPAQHGQQLVVQRIVANSLCDAAMRTLPAGGQASPALLTSATVPAEVEPPPCRLTPISALPLCDTARHARSGVQRA